MTVDTPDGPAVPRGGRFRWWPAVPAGLALLGVAALALPWWRPAAGPVLLGGPGRPRPLPPDTWTGFEVAGPRAFLVGALVVAAVVAAVLGGPRTPAAGAAGGALLACGGAALAGWGTSDATGAWVAAAAGLAALLTALLAAPLTIGGGRRAGAVLVAGVVAAVFVVAVPGGQPPPSRVAAGPYVPVAALAPGPLRSGAAGLPGALGDVAPVVVGGAPGLATPAGVVVVDAHGRARVLARTDRGAPPPLGVVAGGRVVRWAGADTLAVSSLGPGDPTQVLVGDVGAVSALGADGSVWLRSDVDPPETVRRLDPAAYPGEQRLSATYLPVITIQSPPGEAAVDVGQVLPVPGGALRLRDLDGLRQIQLLAGTPTGIAVRPLTGSTAPLCGPAVSTVGDLRAVTADATGVWFPTADLRLAHLGPDGAVRVVDAPLPGQVDALAAAADGSLLVVARDAGGTALWRLPDAVAALAAPAPPC